MARRSPPVVDKKYDTGCTWPMFRLFNFREGHSSKKHLNKQAAGNRNLRSSSDVISRVDEKHPHIGVSSRRRRYHSCKSMSCVENDQVADRGNEVTKMIVDQRFVNKNYQGKDGAGCQTNELFDALQILYSNKELFLKLLKDPNSLLVKQIQDLPSSQVKEPYKPCSPCSFGYNAQNIKPSHLPFGHIKRKLRYVWKARRKKQQLRTTNGVPYKFTCGCQGSDDGKKVKELEIAGRNSLTCVHASIEKGLNSSLDMKRRHNIIKVNDFELRTGQMEAASFGDHCCRNTNTIMSPSEQDISNVHVEDRKSPSEMLNFGIEDWKQCTNSLGRTIPLPDFKSLPSLLWYCEHDSVTKGMKSCNNYQMVLRTKLGLQKEGENGSFSSLGQKINDPAGASVKTTSKNLQLFGSDVSIRKSLPTGNTHSHYDIPRDAGYKDTPTQNFDINNATRGIGSFLDSHPESQILFFSPEVTSSSPSLTQRIQDNVSMENRIEHLSTESIVEQFTEEDATNSGFTILKPDESPVQVIHDKFEENHFADPIRSSLDLINNITSSKDILDCVKEILQAFCLKWDDPFMKCESSHQMLDPSTFDELNASLIGQLSSHTVLLDCVIETCKEVYQNCDFPPCFSTTSADVQAHVVKKVMVKEIKELINLHFLPHSSPITLQQLVGKDLSRRGSRLHIQGDIEDIVVEVEEEVLEKLVSEIVFEMDIRSMIRCNEPVSTRR